MDERKASDILLSIEQIVKNLERKFALQEYQYKLMIDNQNKLLNLLQDDEPEPYPIINNPIEKKPIVMEPIKVEDEFVFRVDRKPIEIPTDDIPPEKEIPVKKNVPEKLIPITQRLVDPNGDPLENIEIRISNDYNEQLKIIRTNSSGRWSSALPSGRYIAKLYGKYKGNRIDTAIAFRIPPNCSITIELPTPALPIPK